VALDERSLGDGAGGLRQKEQLEQTVVASRDWHRHTTRCFLMSLLTEKKGGDMTWPRLELCEDGGSLEKVVGV